jgi:hypothetical protein
VVLNRTIIFVETKQIIMKTIIENLGSVTEKRNFMYDNGNSHYSVLGLDVRIFSRNECFLGNVEYIFTDSKIGNKAIPSTFIKFIGQEEIEVKYSGLFKVEIFLNDTQYVNYVNNKIEVIERRISRLNVVMESIKIRELKYQIRELKKLV